MSQKRCLNEDVLLGKHEFYFLANILQQTAGIVDVLWVNNYPESSFDTTGLLLHCPPGLTRLCATVNCNFCQHRAWLTGGHETNKQTR